MSDKMTPSEIEEAHQLLQTRAEYVEEHRIASCAGTQIVRLFIGARSIDIDLPHVAIEQTAIENEVQRQFRQSMIDCTCENLEVAIDTIDIRLRDLGINIEPFFGHEVDGELVSDFTCDDG